MEPAFHAPPPPPPRFQANAMAKFLNNLPDGTVVATGVKDEGTFSLRGTNAYVAPNPCGADHSSGPLRPAPSSAPFSAANATRAAQPKAKGACAQSC